MINDKLFEHYWNHKKWILKAIGCNVIVLLALLFVFEPTPKSDDYDQVMIVNGGFTGHYSPYLPYCNYFFSKLNQILYSLMPDIAWYYVLQYVLIFISLALVTTIFERKSDKEKHFELLIFIVLLFCGYELYIRFTFTKVAGITIISGFMALLDLILEEQKKIRKYIFPCLLIVVGMTIRISMYLLIAEVFASSFLIFLVETKKFNIYKLKQTVMFVFFVLLFYICNIGLSKFHAYMISQHEAWENWYQVNSVRARLQDYDMADFETYKENYSEIGISYNDYCTWKNQSIYMDKDYFTPELLEDIADIRPIQGEKSIIEILTDTFHSSLSYYLGDTGIYLFFIVAIMLFLLEGKKTLKYISIVFSFCFLAYVYMNYRGRLQHHVDVCILIAGAFLLLYYSCRFKGQVLQKDIKRNILIFSMVLLFIISFYSEVSSSSYYGSQYGNIASKKEQQKKNKETLDVLSKDKKHFYLFAASDTNRIYDEVWEMFQKVELGYYSNLGISNRYYWPNIEETLKNYEIDNVIADSVDSDVIRFAATIHNPGYINIVTTYIREHYNEKAESILEKQVGEVNVYSIVTDSSSR